MGGGLTVGVAVVLDEVVVLLVNTVVLLAEVLLLVIIESLFAILCSLSIKTAGRIAMREEPTT